MGIQNGDGQMRTVFHGSLEEIISPLVHIGRENLDFGKGFYVTDILHQAEVWAGIKSRYFMDAKAVVNEYLFDFDNAIKDFKYKKFERYDGELLHFIVDSRDGKKVWEKYDIIEGGVANDRVIDTVEAFKAGDNYMLSDLLMWNKIGRIVTLLSERLDITPEHALDLFYTSQTNKRLHDPSTLLYTFGDLYIVDEVVREIQIQQKYHK